MNFPHISWANLSFGFHFLDLISKSIFVRERNDFARVTDWYPDVNSGLFQRMSGFETGHPAAAGLLPAFDFSVSDEQDAAFLVSVMDCSDCDSSGLDSPNSSWSIARLKEYLRRKKRTSKREERRGWTGLSPMTSPPHMHNACWPLDGRILHELYFAGAATPRFSPAFDSEWLTFHHLANGSQLHTFSLRAVPFSAFVVHAHSMGDRRTETCGRKKKKKKIHQWHCICFQEATGLPFFAMIGNGRVHRLLGTGRKVKICRRKRSLHRTVLSLTRQFAPSSRRRATNQCFLSSFDGGKLW